MSAPRLRFRAPCALAVVLGLTLVGAPAHAQSSVPLSHALHGAAHDSYDAAKLLLANNDFKGALAKFAQAYDLSKDPRLLFNMALCNKNLHAYAKMEALLEQYAREAEDTMTRSERTAVDSALAAIGGLVGAVRLTVNPDGATVLVDGDTVGLTPLKSPVLVDLGKHTLTVRMDGFDSVDKALDIGGGNSTDLDVSLVRATPTGTLTIAAADTATVTVDGRVVGTGRYHDKALAGVHSVRVTEAGKVPFDSEVDVRDGEARTLEVTLIAEKHAPIWPWFVAGAAVAAAGAAVGGYFLFSPRTTTTPVPTGELGGVHFSSVTLGL